MLQRRRAHRPIRSLAVVAVVGMVASGCSGDSEPTPEVPDQVLRDLTSALGEHTLAGVALTDPQAAEVFATQVEDLADTSVTVAATAGKVTDTTADVALAWTWDVHGQEWTYDTAVKLTKKAQTWQVDWQPAALAPGLGADEALDLRRSMAPRAQILGRKGAILVTDREVLRYGLDKPSLQGKPMVPAARAVARAARVDVPSFVKKVRAAGDKAFVEAITVRADQTGQVASGFKNLPGALVVADTMPLGPDSDFAAEILGKVGPATAEIVEKSEGRIEAGDEVGLSGLQARYDEQLAGTRTTTITAASTCEGAACEESEPRVLKSWPGTAPRPVQLTLDIELQSAAENALDSLAGQQRGASALVAIKPSTGEILAAANGPENDGTNAATFGQYAPGSTFKVVSSLALLRAGMTPTTSVNCPTTTTVDGKRFKNYDDYPSSQTGAITFAAAVANSCNTAFVEARGTLGADDLTAAAADLGLGVDHDLGFPAYFGQAPAAEGKTEKAADMIGQGKILASPMAMASVAASVQSGRTVVPHLLVDPEYAPQASGTSLTKPEAEQLRTLMRGVVSSGSGRFLAPLGAGIGAKTGTAEFGQPQQNGKLLTHTWMIAFSGDLAVAVMVEKGETGSGTAGPVLTQFLQAVS